MEVSSAGKGSRNTPEAFFNQALSTSTFQKSYKYLVPVLKMSPNKNLKSNEPYSSYK